MRLVRRDLPSGTVTFLFTDIEGSTKLLHELGPDGYARALLEHRRILRDAISRNGGAEVDTQGDAFFVAFPTAPGAVDAAREAQETLASGPIRVRMGLHTGSPHLTEEGYVGEVVHKGARIAAAGHGGQVLLSKETRDLVDASVTDLGEHRLKDFDGPVSIFQLGSEGFPPLKTISNTNLPRPASSFVGRDREVEEVVSLLQNGARLLTLTGPGGSGKTRLAIEAAADLVPEFKAGVFWVGLSPLRDPSLVTDTIARTLGAKDRLAEHIGARELLLLLDNLEQVIEAAPELASLVESCPNLKLLITSRELLRVRGEVEYPVLPLADPDAVELFCARSRLTADDTIAELCGRLDYLPLAIELAAARATVLSPRQILERLSSRLDLLKGGRDAHPRQQTLRATIEWSHDLLIEDEERLFARLAVFRGGCTLEAAEEIAKADLDILQSLVDKSLLRHTGDRFWMLETIQEFAAERLEESGEAAALGHRHAAHFLALAEEAYPHLIGHPKAWLDGLEREHDNLRAALDRLEISGETQEALRLAGALSRFWYQKRHVTEGGRRLEDALRADERPTPARARALNGATYMANVRGDVAAAKRWAHEALTLHRRLGDAWGTAYSTYLLGQTAKEVSDWATARDLFEESLRAFRELGDEHYTLMATDLLGLACYKLGDRERARALHEENLRGARASDNAGLEAMELGALGLYAADEGRVQDAIPLLVQSTRIWRDIGEQFDDVGQNVCSFARLVAITGKPRVAVQLLSAAASMNDEVGAAPSTYVADLNEGTIAIIHRHLDEVAFAEAWEQGQKLTLDEAVALALEEAD
jgi:predicted ATPase/class 3 adenylate cyclase